MRPNVRFEEVELDPETLRLGEAGQLAPIVHLPLPVYREARPQLQLSNTYACNLTCGYCSFRDRMHEDGRPTNMKREIAESAIQQFADRLRTSGDTHARIDYGLTGETFLRKQTHAFFDAAIESAFASGGVDVEAGPHVTNGTVPTIGNEVVLGDGQDISLDGPPDVHNRLRKYINGKDSYDDVEATARKALAGNPGVGVSAVLTAYEFDFWRVLTHLTGLGFRSVYMKPVNLPHDVEYGLNPGTLDGFKRGYSGIVEGILSSDDTGAASTLNSLNEEDFFMRFFRRVLFRTPLRWRCGAGKSGMYVDTDGLLYPCAHFIGKTGWSIGDVESGIDEERVAPYKEDPLAKEPCRSCPVRHACGGGCHYQAVLANGDPNKPDWVKCSLIEHLVYEATRLIVSSQSRREVLLSLPSPLLVRDELVSSDPTTTYEIETKLTPTTRLKLHRPAKTTGALVADLDDACVGLRLASGRIQVRFRDVDGLDSVNVWVVDDAETFTVQDALLQNPLTSGRLWGYKAGQVFEWHPRGGAEVGLSRGEWLPSSQLSSNMTPNGEIVLDVTAAAGSGLNIILNYSNGSTVKLVKREPFVVVPDVDAPNGQEFGTTMDLDELVEETCRMNLVPDGWTAISVATSLSPNVC